MPQQTRDKHRLAGLSQGLLALGLLLLWCLLWGSFTPLTIITGILVSLGVSFTFYLPGVELSGRVNPWRVIVFFVVLAWDILRASIQIAWLAFAPNFKPGNAIVGIPLNTRSDLIMSWTSTAISIVPGSIVVDLDRSGSILYVHVIDVHSEEDIQRFIQEVLDTERRLVLAIGSKAEVVRVNEQHALARGRKNR
ncbi:multicomponent Na+:H+ antiporter subunit E [Mycetocola sp. BIGb0189]|uniref:Na+/H+ antiporter subunit E n=1 Tax=Mycetocola sp. BIGb0189 TaxID=2940604 RepID=UPI002168FEC9|nr:Na+/H+ antiporter subunit E [Mycetocola sp. BIGb0189]MCS4277804.1 multicomponent Na+:H+ antiporter subunit E [Mycetocola sp. BIGb0189]